jgi:RNA polymerase sigma-70 factor (ECF subfamily)
MRLANQNARSVRMNPEMSALATAINVRGAMSGPAPPPRRRRRADRRAERALRERQPDALALVMEAHGRTLLGFLIHVLRDRGAAEDVLQQVLLEVWQHAEHYDPERASLLTWVLTIARSRALDELRRRVPEPLDPAVAAAQAEGVPSGADEADRLLERWRMAALLERLPRDEAGLLRLRFYEGLTQNEIAQRTGVPAGTVKTRMVNGLRHLRDLLEAEERSERT